MAADRSDNDCRADRDTLRATNGDALARLGGNATILSAQRASNRQRFLIGSRRAFIAAKHFKKSTKIASAGRRGFPQRRVFRQIRWEAA